MDIKFGGFGAPLLGRIKPVSGVTPFTYHDGATYLEILSKMEGYIKKDLVPGVNQEFENFLGNLNGFIEELENGLSVDRDRIQVVFDEFTSLVTADVEKVTDKVDLINNKTGPADIQRITLTTPTRELILNPAWPNNQPVEFVVTQDTTGNRKLTFPANVRAAIDLDPAPGAVTTFTMVPEGDGSWFAYQSFSTVSGGVSDTVNRDLLDNEDSLFRDAVNGRIDSLIDSRVPDLSTNTALEELENTGSALTEAVRSVANDRFPNLLAPWGEKVKRVNDWTNPGTAVLLVLGSSTAEGAATTDPGKYGWAGRIGAYLGAPAPIGIAYPVTRPGSGVGVFTGAIGGTTSANYLPNSFLPNVAVIRPDLVMHMIGANDYAQGVDLETYRSNLVNAIGRIRSQAPDTVQILIHQQARIDMGTPKHSWESYGRIMREVAESSPGELLYLDIDARFRELGLTPRGDRAGLMADYIHMGDAGHKILADMISEFIGTPIVYGGTEAYFATTFKGGEFGSSTVEAEYARITIPAHPYPRKMRVSFMTYAGSAAESEIYVRGFTASDTTLPGESIIIRIEGNRRTVGGNTIFNVPANTAAKVIATHNNNKYLTSAAGFANFTAELTPM